MRSLRRQTGKGICVLGGGELAASFLAAGIIDEVGLNIHPVLLGSGTPMFRDPGRRIHLSLLEGRVMDGGCLLANYRVTHSP
jgi:dihydrofolate reductase